jgi:hypothetical protein
LEEAEFEQKESYFTWDIAIVGELCTKVAGVQMYYRMSEMTVYKPAAW